MPDSPEPLQFARRAQGDPAPVGPAEWGLPDKGQNDLPKPAMYGGDEDGPTHEGGNDLP